MNRDTNNEEQSHMTVEKWDDKDEFHKSYREEESRKEVTTTNDIWCGE